MDPSSKSAFRHSFSSRQHHHQRTFDQDTIAPSTGQNQQTPTTSTPSSPTYPSPAPSPRPGLRLSLHLTNSQMNITSHSPTTTSPARHSSSPSSTSTSSSTSSLKDTGSSLSNLPPAPVPAPDPSPSSRPRSPHAFNSSNSYFSNKVPSSSSRSNSTSSACSSTSSVIDCRSPKHSQQQQQKQKQQDYLLDQEQAACCPHCFAPTSTASFSATPSTSTLSSQRPNSMLSTVSSPSSLSLSSLSITPAPEDTIGSADEFDWTSSSQQHLPFVSNHINNHTSSHATTTAATTGSIFPSSFPSQNNAVAFFLQAFQTLDPSTQLTLLSELVDNHCTTPQLTFLSNVIAPKLKRDFLKDLPLELAHLILSFIDDPRSLARVGQVSKFWHQLVETEDWVWRTQCIRMFGPTSCSSLPSPKAHLVPPRSYLFTTSPTSLDVVSNTLKALSRRSSSYTSGSNNHGGSSASGSSTSTPTSSASSSNASSTTTSPAWRTASELPILSGMSSSSSSSSSSEQDASTTTTGREATAGTIAHAAVGVTSPTTMVTSNASTTTVLSSMLLANQGSLVPPASHHHHHHHHSHHHRSRTGVVPSGAGMGIGIGASAGTGVGSSSSASSSLIMRSDKPSLFRNKDWSSLSRGEGGSDGGGSTDVIPAGADVDEGLVQKKYQQEDELVLAQSSVTTTTIATIESGEAATAATSSLSSASRQSKERARKFVLSSAWSHLSSSKAESNATAETTAAASVSPPTTTTPPLSTSAIARSLLSLSTAGSALLPTHGTNVAANNMSSPSTSASPTSLLPHAQSSYKAYFKRRYMIDRNWISGDHSLISYTTPETGVVTSLQFDHHHIVVGCDNSRIQIFETTTGRLVRTLQGHLGGVWALEFIKGVVDPTDPYRSSGAGDKILVSGGCDREVRVWDMTTGVCRQVMSGHTGTIRCLKIYKFDRKKSTSSTPSSPITSSATPSSSIQYLAVTGSRDATLRVWDIQTGQKKFLLHGHRSSVRCIEIHGDLLVSGSYDCTARVWSLITGECLLVLQGHFQQIYSIAFNGEYIITGSLDSTCRLWSPVTGACLATLQGHTQLVGQLQLSGDSLMTGGGDGFMYLWNLKTFECQYRVQAHDLSVTSLCFDSKRIVTGGNDGAVKLWDRLTGKFIRLLTKTDAMIWRVAICEERVVICMQKNGRTAMEVMCFDSEAPLLGSPGSTSQNLDLLSNTTLSSLASASPSSSSRSSAATPVAAHQLYHLQQQQQHVSESASEQPHPQWSLDDGSSALSAFDSLGV